MEKNIGFSVFESKLTEGYRTFRFTQTVMIGLAYSRWVGSPGSLLFSLGKIKSVPINFANLLRVRDFP